MRSIKRLRPSALCCLVLYTFPDGRKLILDSKNCLTFKFDVEPVTIETFIFNDYFWQDSMIFTKD